MKKKLYVTKCLSMICALVCTFSVLCGSAVAKEPGIELLYTGVTVLYADINYYKEEKLWDCRCWLKSAKREN